MIPEIGIMIGVYIITKMTSLLTRKGDKQESTLVRIFAGITILVALFSVIDLLFRGTTDIPTYPRF